MTGDALAHFVVPGLGRGNEATARSRTPEHSQSGRALAAAASATDQDHMRIPDLRLRSIQMKNGPPSRAVITPTGISTGARMVREKTSHRATNAAPSRNEHGARMR